MCASDRRTVRSVDILVNNAATNPYMGPSIDIDLARYDKTVQVNLRVRSCGRSWHGTPGSARTADR